MIFFSLNYNQLLLYGVHVGHSIANTLLYSAWMISALDNLFQLLIYLNLNNV